MWHGPRNAAVQELLSDYQVVLSNKLGDGSTDLMLFQVIRRAVSVQF